LLYKFLYSKTEEFPKNIKDINLDFVEGLVNKFLKDINIIN